MLIKKKAFKKGYEFSRILFKPEMNTMCSGFKCKNSERVLHEDLCNICNDLNQKIAVWKSCINEQFCFIPRKYCSNVS